MLAAAAALIGAAILTLALGASRSHGQSIDELNSRIDAAQGEAESLASDIQAKTDQLAAARSQAAAAAAREAQLSATLAQGQEREAELEAQVAVAQSRLAEARARLHRALDALAKRLVAIYKGDPPDATSLLLSSDGFDDLATRAELLGRIQDADRALAERVRALRAAVADQLAAVEQARDRQQALNAQIAAARDQIAAVRAQAESQAAALADARAAQAAALGDLRSQVGDWEQQVEEAQQVSAAQAQEEVADWVGDWAIPEAIVMCESGGSFDAVNPSSGAGGAYQILPSTWSLYGGHGSPQNASPQQQSDIAAQIWADSGSSAWECAG